ncbi:MAG: type II toxin-antitoxin system RelE/ParE family toxin [Alphaproteobacteria bacterium]|nr:type II toxin-antitoxin system RelE/ParE family toxin [Alphaproteobacteria bacterium]
MKPLIWLGNSLKTVSAFEPVARREAGYQLHRLQEGKDPSDWKPMSSVGLGVREIRIHTGRAYRLLYVAKFREGIYVLHAFEKKTMKTPAADIDLAARRFKAIAAKDGGA